MPNNNDSPKNSNFYKSSASTTELDKIFYYSQSNDIYADISFMRMEY